MSCHSIELILGQEIKGIVSGFTGSATGNQWISKIIMYAFGCFRV